MLAIADEMETNTIGTTTQNMLTQIRKQISVAIGGSGVFRSGALALVEGLHCACRFFARHGCALRKPCY